jgi:ketosteroid isomerase-like protein
MTDLLQTAKAFYGLVLTDPVAAGEQYLSEDFVLENYLPEHFPFGGRYEGREGTVRYLVEISDAIEMGPLIMDEWLCDDTSVVARGREASLVRSTGRKYDMLFVHWLSFDDAGRITHMREFNDTAEMAKAFDGT